MIALKRVTNSQVYLPFIDGLRFFSILAVVLVHFIDFYEAHTFKISQAPLYRQLHVGALAGDSDNGVLIFFAISGFVLGLPFAKSILSKQTQPQLKSFYFKRLTRLEPPYLLILTALLVLNVFAFHKFSFSETLPHYLASFFYLHNIIYQSYPELNFVFWSLEIEVQFYLLAPLLARVFKLDLRTRRFVLLFSILIFGLLNHYIRTPFISLFNYLQYFLAGFLALELFLNNSYKKHYLFDVCCLFLITWIWTGLFKYGVTLPFLIALLIYFSSVSIIWEKILSLKWISIIGGMCYSIYMLHHPLMAVFFNRVLGNAMMLNSPMKDFGLKMLITLIVVCMVSALFFILIERPCMKRDWYKRFLLKRSTAG